MHLPPAAAGAGPPLGAPHGHAAGGWDPTDTSSSAVPGTDGLAAQRGVLPPGGGAPTFGQIDRYLNPSKVT